MSKRLVLLSSTVLIVASVITISAFTANDRPKADLQNQTTTTSETIPPSDTVPTSELPTTTEQPKASTQSSLGGVSSPAPSPVVESPPTIDYKKLYDAEIAAENQKHQAILQLALSNGSDGVSNKVGLRGEQYRHTDALLKIEQKYQGLIP